MASGQRVSSRLAAITFVVALPIVALVQHVLQSRDPTVCDGQLELVLAAVASPSCVPVRHFVLLDLLLAGLAATAAWHIARAGDRRRPAEPDA